MTNVQTELRLHLICIQKKFEILILQITKWYSSKSIYHNEYKCWSVALWKVRFLCNRLPFTEFVIKIIVQSLHLTHVFHFFYYSWFHVCAVDWLLHLINENVENIQHKETGAAIKNAVNCLCELASVFTNVIANLVHFSVHLNVQLQAIPFKSDQIQIEGYPRLNQH